MSAPSRGDRARTYRYMITARVLNGKQTYIRQPYPNATYTLSGHETSLWNAQWPVRVTINRRTREVRISHSLTFSPSGTAAGDFSGSYPRSGGRPPASYSCAWGPARPKDVLSRARLYGTGRTDGQVHLFFGVDREPASFPRASCTGDPVDPLVHTTVRSGVFTGLESGCVREQGFRGKRLLRGRSFAYQQRFSWGPNSAPGESVVCNGFGSPTWSFGTGTLKVRFRRLR
ncbi:MAG: hypothetical protein M3R70_06955 [Actinomycetota bacterium]|nr:hypothetical protein [Actinomycetota bacterium]